MILSLKGRRFVTSDDSSLFVAVIFDTLCLACRKDGMVSFEAFERLMLRLDITMDADHAVFFLTMASSVTLKLHNLQL